MSDMKAYIKAKHAGQNPIIPRHGDVTMRPGKNGEGWWQGEEKGEQVELLADIFNAVFNIDLDLTGAPPPPLADAAAAATCTVADRLVCLQAMCAAMSSTKHWRRRARSTLESAVVSRMC